MANSDVAPTMYTWYSWLVLFMLFLVYLLNQWDRQLIAYVWNATTDQDSFTNMSYATHSNTDEYGWLVGPGFVFLFIITGLFVGRLADVFNRKLIILIGLVIWSGAIVGQGFATTFWHLLVARVILGIGQAFSAPASYSIIAAYFPEEVRGRANGLFSTAIYFGGALSSISATLTKQLGWRMLNWVVGGVGILVALAFLLLVREPPRATKKKDDDEKETPTNSGEVLTTLEAIKETFRHPVVLVIFATTGIRFMAGYTLGSFAPKFFQNTFGGDYYQTYLVLNAFVVSLGGMISANMGGIISDYWAKHNPRARGFVPAIGTFISIPCMAGVCLLPHVGLSTALGFYLSIFCLFLEYIFAECFFGCVFATLTSKVAPGARAFASSTFIFISSACGSLGPVIIGKLDTHYSGYYKEGDKTKVENPAAIAYILAIAVCSLYFLSALGFTAMGMMLPSTPNPVANEGADLKDPLLAQEADEEI